MISQRWIDQQKGKLAHLQGQAKEELAKEIADAEDTLASQRGKLKSHGLRVNTYPGNCVVTGVRVQGGEGYCRKAADGRWLTYSKAGAAEAFGI